VVRATGEDAEREPLIRERGLPVAYDGPEGLAGPPTMYVLNVLDAAAEDGLGPCAFLDAGPPGGPASCTIHATRPDVCRAVDCSLFAGAWERLHALGLLTPGGERGAK
jgi:Fe-S-cluster containining protein